MCSTNKDVTTLLASISEGDDHALRKLFLLVYDELRAIAHNAMRKAAPGQTLQSTALVGELFIRFEKSITADWKNRSHFFAAAAQAMRHLLIDYHRRKKPKAMHKHEPLHEENEPALQIESPHLYFDDFEALYEALDNFESVEGHERKVRVIEMIFFLGWTVKKTAQVTGVSWRTVQNDLNYATAWLSREMKRVTNDGVAPFDS